MNTPNPCNSEHEFVLVLSGSTDLDDSLMDALFEAGCDDATPSLKYGRISMMFTRVAPSFQEAVYTAIRDVKKTGLADVYSMDECSLVSQADIAEVTFPRDIPSGAGLLLHQCPSFDPVIGHAFRDGSSLRLCQ